jgi:prepilin-type processing-associated H-X9-DG protein
VTLGRIHRGGDNVLFCDGHVTWYKQEDLIWREGISTEADRHRLHRMWVYDQKDFNGKDW